MRFSVTLDCNEGLGLILGDNDSAEQPETVVVGFSELQPGLIGPAEKSGLIEPDDRLVEVDGEDVSQLSYEAVLGTITEHVNKSTISLGFSRYNAPFAPAVPEEEAVQLLPAESAQPFKKTHALVLFTIHTFSDDYKTLITLKPLISAA